LPCGEPSQAELFQIVRHPNKAVEEVRRSEMRRLSRREKVPFKRSRWLLLQAFGDRICIKSFNVA
jgi:hypothetical protein